MSASWFCSSQLLILLPHWSKSVPSSSVFATYGVFNYTLNLKCLRLVFPSKQIGADFKSTGMLRCTAFCFTVRCRHCVLYKLKEPLPAKSKPNRQYLRGMPCTAVFKNTINWKLAKHLKLRFKKFHQWNTCPPLFFTWIFPL